MRKFTQLVLTIIAIFTITNVFAIKEVKVTGMVEPASGSNVHANFPVDYKIVVQNSGDEAILITDSIYLAWGVYNGSTVQLQPPVRYMFKALNPGDTFHYVWRLTINSPNPGQIGLGFLASLSLQITKFKGVVVPFNLTTDIFESSNNAKNIWYSNGQIYFEFVGQNNSLWDIKIYNLNGKLVKVNKVDLSTDNDINSIDVGYLEKGVYIFNMSNDNGEIISKKIMIQ